MKFKVMHWELIRIFVLTWKLTRTDRRKDLGVLVDQLKNGNQQSDISIKANDSIRSSKQITSRRDKGVSMYKALGKLLQNTVCGSDD